MSLPKKTKIISIVVLLIVAIGCVIYINTPESSATSQSTEDAYVQADFTFVTPQISGTIHRVLVEENQQVKAGDLLATINDEDFIVAVDAAKAQVENANAHIASIKARLAQQQTTIRQAQAAIDVDNAELKLAKENQTRYRNLAADGSGTVQAMQQAEAQLSIRLANRDKNLAGLDATKQQVDILKTELESAKAALSQAKAAQAAAELKLSYTQITAPITGMIGQKSVRAGTFVNTGKPLLVIVPLDKLYITANFRETQLAHIKTGQSVDFKVDALPNTILKGTVESVGPASGVSYSAVAPHNATGNFTKIVQRLPVRIHIIPNQPEAKNLRVGMSVIPTIYIKDK
ncbi:MULTISPECIES: HlyD family secretion protein [Acinetobacter]|uniref:HlyD family secretion protein n=1 Tax=Acinetobacter TaxID=469 RepID=UPI000743A509|nr:MULTISPECIES: HlyD family secretion protein [Acinetobacter]EHU2434064.1 HlyD family secretion protein [Acinetobacter baumannii]EIB6924222.1 HlyD family secretion protein [Acinetobacter baumannii]MCU4587025.1 HlyD family secretion protein [Acinetobacter nosocomialis]MDA4925474.1 HlyD family secretion protein [Acinetobacter baumannii]TPT19683.1 HlyD family secretion protein [Acinetobacter baumannii]